MWKNSKEPNIGFLILLSVFLPMWIPIGIVLYSHVPLKAEHVTVYFSAIAPFSYILSKKVCSFNLYNRIVKFCTDSNIDFFFYALVLFICVFLTASLAVLLSVLMYSMPQWVSIGLAVLMIVIGCVLVLVDRFSSGS